MEKWKNDAIELKRKIEGVNNWIKVNPQVTSPNMYEFTQFLAEYGEIMGEADRYYESVGYPMVTVQGEQRRGLHYDLHSISPELRSVADEIRELSNSRKILTATEDKIDFLKRKEIADLLGQLFYRSSIAEYYEPKNEYIRKTQKELLCKLLGVSYYIWETKQNNPDYVYDNKDEYELMQHMLELCLREKTQFSELMKNVFDTITDEYKYSDNKQNRNLGENTWQSNAVALKQKIEGVNSWIKANPQITEPNMEEYTRLFVECGEVFREACKYYNEKGYPTIKDEKGVERSANHYDLMWIPALRAIRDELETLAALRKLHTNDENSFTSVPCVKEFYQEMFQRVYCGEYELPEDKNIQTMKKDVLRQCMAISFYIWDTKRKEPEYVYDNKAELDNLYAMYEAYTKSVGKSVHIGDGNGNFTSYAQFGKQIEGMLEFINKNYLYAEENTNAKIK